VNPAPFAGKRITDFNRCRVDPSQLLAPDFFVPSDSAPPPGVSLKPKA
jgi:citronellol/citronellal dehydrogenase